MSPVATEIEFAWVGHAPPMRSPQSTPEITPRARTLTGLEGQWPREHAPQGFVLLYAPSFHGSDITLAQGETLKIANRVQSPSVRGNPVRGPFLVLIVVGQYPEARGFVPLRAYAQPILNGRMFLPVDSDFERSVLRIALRCQRELHGRGVELALEKPLFDTLTPDGPCRPDVLLEARSNVTGEVRSIVIEAMGFETDEYMAAKSITHPRMRHCGEIVTVDRRRMNEDGARAAIMRALDL